MPSGTTHWLNGKDIEVGAPPISIWQNKLPSGTVPLMAADWKVRLVPGCIGPVFVTANDGLGVTPKLHPEMKGPAKART